MTQRRYSNIHWMNELIQFISNSYQLSVFKIYAQLASFSPTHCCYLSLNPYHSHLNLFSSPLPGLPPPFSVPPHTFFRVVLSQCISEHILSYIKLSNGLPVFLGSNLNSFKALHDLVSAKLSKLILYHYFQCFKCFHSLEITISVLCTCCFFFQGIFSLASLVSICHLLKKYLQLPI